MHRRGQWLNHLGKLGSRPTNSGGCPSRSRGARGVWTRAARSLRQPRVWTRSGHATWLEPQSRERSSAREASANP